LRDKISHYLQQHLVGEVMTSKDALDYFSTDGSVFTIRPKVIVYPRNTNDVRKVARFTWQLAERGHIIPTTARGKGTDWSGAAIGEGVILVFPAHMNKILELDKDHVVVQPGAIYAKVEQSLHTHYRFLPPYPASLEYSTIGGAVANNSAGEKSFKYSDTRKYTKSLNVVLANGELIEIGGILQPAHWVHMSRTPLVHVGAPALGQGFGRDGAGQVHSGNARSGENEVGRALD